MIRIQQLWQKKQEVSIKEVSFYVEYLASIIPIEKYNSIYAVPNGGYIIAIILSNLLRIPLVIKPEKKTLIVDDLIDSGKTMKLFPENDKAVLYVKNKRYDEVTYYAEITNNWLIFPWEIKKIQTKS